jgi:hypothetical protein
MEDLRRRARQGDVAAIEALVAHYRRALDRDAAARAEHASWVSLGITQGSQQCLLEAQRLGLRITARNV